MTPFDVLSDVKRRTVEAVIAQSGLAHEGLRRHLRVLLGGNDPLLGAMLQEPVLEGAHPFVTAEMPMAALAPSPLHGDFVAALDGLPADHDYRFPRTRRPFLHQAQAWRILAERDPQSVLVTSGTGSGKTECFLFPILSDLVSQAQGRREPLEGVQAIMLYPLNALIESQRERLSAWTQPFGGRLRYCLYNGDLQPAAKESDRRRTPEQVIDRERLRASPPPLLVTNITMLEYMLVRAEDRPIIDSSQGKLKWIVLDEAHSLVGAAAAEIALLLRRVMLAFSIAPEQVRFVATSATIGSGENVQQQLQRFLAEVAGIPDDRVHVIEGRRRMPLRPGGESGRTPPDIRTADPAALYDLLGRDPKTWRLVERLFDGGVPLADFEEPAKTYDVGAADLVVAMSRAARKTDDLEEERLAPIRLHAFERAVPGVWSCINPECPDRPSDWPFGRILAERADQCPCCGAPVLEVVSCNECGEAYLEGIEAGPRLSAPLRNPPRDEFAFDSGREGEDRPDDTDNEDENEDQNKNPVWTRLFAATPTSAARKLHLDPSIGWQVTDQFADGGLTLLYEDYTGPRACPHCTPTGRKDHDLIRPLRFGAPFILGNAAPILLEGVEPAKTDAEERLPAAGRRLLSFTDSRQGTARMAAKLETESERNFVRSFIYHQVQASMRPPAGADDQVAKLRGDIQQLESIFATNPQPILESMIAKNRRELANLTSGSTDGIAWPELVNRLASRIEVAEWIKGLWQARDEELFTNEFKIAEFLLLREFTRRPYRANSAETLGVARLRNPSIDRLSETHLPAAFRRRGKTTDDWRGYLDAILTWFVRANGAIAISWQMQHWVSSRAKLRSLVGPDERTDGDKRLHAWPNGQLRANPRSRPVALLMHGLRLALDQPADRSDLDDCLRVAWSQILATLSSDPERRIFDFTKTFVAPVVDGFLCPVTRRVLDRAPFGLTPYGIEERTDARRRAASITLPRLPVPILGAANFAAARADIQAWLESDPMIADLRAKGAWTNISDRIALFADYARSAEHSAQQDSRRLRRYEHDFKAGRINILNCSTTMEMGVDIGSVSSVMMTNVPPSIANYRQRVGRAGRRGQAVALSFTFCKDRPLDREAFRDPRAFLRRTLSAPKVTLSSRPIVQRHVNAFLLGCFMREHAGDALKMQIGAFIGCPSDPKDARPLKAERPVEVFIDWLERPATASRVADDIARLTRRSVLEGDRRLVEDATDAIKALAADFVAEWEGLVALAKDEGLQDAGRSRMAVELRRMCGEFLLGSLADRGFLPGHGFPTDVVSFIPGKEFKAGPDAPPDGTRQFRTVGPQRSLDLAIRDYAPGSEVVLDGLVHKSAGVTLNWKRPASAENLAEVQSLRHFWRCVECGASDTRRAGSPDFCPICGADRPTSVEFIRPAGFSVDPRVRAHADTDILSYVPPEDPVVSARDATWHSLPVPELGRYRCSREGLVYYSNRGGPRQFGYALCLQCGRAEPDTDNRGLASPPPALVDHKPLRYRNGQDVCPGNDKPFSIKRNLSLGLEITTDVFELQPHHTLRRAGANALVIALREALAQELGIEADEMGFAVDQTRNALGAPAISLFLFDRAAGGAGFAISFEHLLRPVLQRAQHILDCRTPGCERACAACVLTSDAPDGKDELDRTAALAFMRAHLTLPDELDGADRFTDDAVLSLTPLDEINRELRRVEKSALTIFLPTGTTPAALQDWTVAPQLLHWAMRGHPVTLAFPTAQIDAMSSADKLAIRDFVLQHKVALVTAEAPALANGGIALATIEPNGRSESRLVWATREAEPRFPGPHWARPSGSPVVRGRTSIASRLAHLDLATLLPPPGAQISQIGSELDGDLATFGIRASKLLIQLLTQCGVWPGGGISRATYQDAYVCSPLVARLLIDTMKLVFAQSGNASAALVVETQPPRVAGSRGEPWQIFHDWRDAVDQRAVIEALGTRRDIRVSLQHKDVPHGRFLDVEFANGHTATIVLDQGFGAWGPPRSVVVRHDFGADHATQAKRLTSVNAALQRRRIGKTYVVATSGKL
ncbi:DEAD/DEAH box helicase [Rhodoplanes azumiensis]|uniref:DEAD/DEAH box helicase n=1 Tax=Rhodoplanes azumiensis TaxID=1897628 RepID=A0ABW5ARL4_9BRAD